MPWFKVDDNLGFHHKVVAAGNPAMGLWVRAGSICAQQLTDGFVPDHMVMALGTKSQAEKLVLVGLWDHAEGGYSFHGWEERQPSKVDVEAERAAAKERMRIARARKRQATQGASPQVSEVRSESVRANTDRTSPEVRETFGNPDPTRPIPTRPDPQKEPSGSPSATPRKRPATRLPDDWTPTASHWERRHDGIDVQREADTFKAHAEANDRRCVNWNAAFTQWLLKARPAPAQPAAQPHQGRAQQWMQLAADLENPPTQNVREIGNGR